MVTRLPSDSADPDIRLARQVREQYGRTVLEALEKFGPAIVSALDTAQRDGKRYSLSEMTRHMEAASAFRRLQNSWLDAMRRQWLQAERGFDPQKRRADIGPADFPGRSDRLELVEDDVVENRIIASRLAAAASGQAGDEWRDLRVRVRRLERSDELARNDPLRADVLGRCVIEAWTDAGLQHAMWPLAERAVQEVVAKHLGAAWRQANETLEQYGWSAELDLRKNVRRSADTPWQSTRDSGSHHDATGGSTGSFGMTPAKQGDSPDSQSTVWHGASRRADRTGSKAVPEASATWRSAPSRRYEPKGSKGLSSGGDLSFDSVRPSALAQAAQETRMVTGMSHMTRVRQRAQGVWGQLRRMLIDQVDGFDPASETPGSLSAALQRALADTDPDFAITQLIGTSDYMVVHASADVGVVATQLRHHATELKSKTDKASEKATIEVVALMFQAILAEERIAAGIRVWFARLQLPILRLALAEPDFFASIEHPARQLIDRMGSCALGFEQAQITDELLEPEIRRIVQVIEQYPETGRRVYELVLGEFKKFLTRSLVESGARQQAVTLAQRVEQKEALAVQYTIELRRMLQALSVDSAVREFLFRVWSDVLAMAAVRHGPQDQETMRHKQVAADLIWAVSPKPERAERSQVVKQLPGLLHSLRNGMATLAVTDEEQDSYIKGINNAVMRAFMLRDEGIPAERLRELSQSLAGLEDVVTDDPQGDMWLDPGMIELMFGEDSAVIEVIAEGGSTPVESVTQWARHLDLGAWFSLEHGDAGRVTHVQYVWRSQRGQLHLFAAGNDKNYLVQTQRLAAYLQAGLLVPAEDEALTVRATREALTQIQDDPEQLFL